MLLLLVGCVVPTAGLAAEPAPFSASARPLSEAERTAMTPAAWRPGCPVGLDDLRHLDLAYWRPDGTQAVGVLVVAATVVEPVTTAFHSLWVARFPIERMEPVEVYGGDDNRSMEANNTSGFNCRGTIDAAGFSRHSYGAAIDVNPLWNPAVKAVAGQHDGLRVQPESGRPWVDRTRADPGMIRAGDAAVQAFTAVGWRWGGAWRSLKDYQHFSADGR